LLNAAAASTFILRSKTGKANAFKFFAEGARLEKEKTYTVAFVTEQGVPKKYGANRRDLDVKAIAALKNYLEKNSPVSAELRGAVVAV